MDENVLLDTLWGGCVDVHESQQWSGKERRVIGPPVASPVHIITSADHADHLGLAAPEPEAPEPRPQRAYVEPELAAQDYPKPQPQRAHVEPVVLDNFLDYNNRPQHYRQKIAPRELYNFHVRNGYRMSVGGSQTGGGGLRLFTTPDPEDRRKQKLEVRYSMKFIQ